MLYIVTLKQNYDKIEFEFASMEAMKDFIETAITHGLLDVAVTIRVEKILEEATPDE